MNRLCRFVKNLISGHFEGPREELQGFPTGEKSGSSNYDYFATIKKFQSSRCVVREEDRKRYGVTPREKYAETEDLNRIAKWQPGELERMAETICMRVVEPILLQKEEQLRVQKAAEFARGYAEGQKAERDRCLKHSDHYEGLGSDGTAECIGDRIRSGE